MKQLSPDLSHKPVVLVNYENKDADAGDAIYLSIGKATWNDDYNSKDFSAKIFRVTDKQRWSPRSEELPLWRVLDLAILIASVITGKQCDLAPYYKEDVTKEDIINMNKFLQSKNGLLKNRLKELKKIIEDI